MVNELAQPTFTANAGIYEITFPDDHVTIRFDRLREDHMQVNGEVRIRTSLPGVLPHLHQARLNLTSTIARRDLAKLLNERAAGPDWFGRLEFACVTVLEHYRKGEPAIALRNVPARDKTKWRLEPFIAEGQANLIYGEGGIGKSILAAMMGVVIDTPVPEYCDLEPEPGRVLYLDWETSQDELADRVAAIYRGIGDGLEEAPASMLYRFCSRSLSEDVEYIQRIIADEKVNMVVIDSMGLACGAEPEASDAVLRYFTALRSLRVTSLTLDHTNKAGGLFGSVYKYNMARNVWELKKSQEEGQSSFSVGLYHRKANNGPLLKPRGFKITWGDGVVTFETVDVMDDATLAKAASYNAQITATLDGAKGGLTIKELADETMLKSDVIRLTINRHREDYYKFPSTGKEARWGLAYKGQDAPPPSSHIS